MTTDRMDTDPDGVRVAYSMFAAPPPARRVGRQDRMALAVLRADLAVRRVERAQSP